MFGTKFGSMVCLVALCACMSACECVFAKILLKHLDLGVWNSVEPSSHLVWLECFGCLGVLGVAGCAWFPHPSHLLSLPLSAQAFSLALTTIHSPTLALISPFVRPPFRVGLDVELLLVTGYAWTPRSWTRVEVSRLGLVS